MSIIPPFLNSLPKWAPIVKGKHLLFDTDAIISIIEYDAKDIFKTLNNLDVVFCIIHPVYIELLKSDNPAKRLERQTILDEYKFQILPITQMEMNRANDIQNYLLLSKSYSASPTDLYLGGRLSTLSTKTGSIFLLTSNLSDFPTPLYARETGIVLQNIKNNKIISILSINNSELNTPF